MFKRPLSKTVSVATAGTAVRLESVANKYRVSWICIQALETNTGDVVVGDLTANESGRIGVYLTAGQKLEIPAGEANGQGALDLHEVFIDAAVNGEGVSYIALTN